MTQIPFLKWPGGKRWFVQNHADLLPTDFQRYIEPFLGGGSVFFHLKPAKAILADANRELISAYRGIRFQPQRLVRLLQYHARRHSHRHYYTVRASKPTSLLARAARLIYLNRTSFNGIYRVNREGIFNVPKGDRDTVLFSTDDFPGIAHLLRGSTLQTCDFADTLSEACKGDLVFADPPYTVRHDNNGFRKYNEVLFSWDDQVRLAQALGRARDRGALIVATNANHSSVRKLYRELDFHLMKVSRFSAISADPGSRRELDELVIRSHSD
jgi:DNA adenine methylase